MSVVSGKKKGTPKTTDDGPLTTDKYQVKLLGLDTFDPVTMDPDHLQGDNVPAWFLDTDYNDLCFHVSQAFFPRHGDSRQLQRLALDSAAAHVGRTWRQAFRSET